ncbi:hypothetical protein [Anaerosalibacter sp. Marseille-P3206]|uniref:hypothetical protein n=1 Tax=Anaerosalibacter sp. Marseille-P3206 TaxID=1871005 RepID=UPI0009877C05|nr:hypothetical protein [Anaerosalibacter sp. Marseille-P3206]
MDNIDTKELERLIKKQKENKKKGRFSKFIVVLVILLNVIFTAGIFYVFTRVGNEPSTLIVSWFGFTTVELWSLSKIKREANK